MPRLLAPSRARARRRLAAGCAVALLAVVAQRGGAQEPARVWVAVGGGPGVHRLSCRDCTRVGDPPVRLAGFAAAGWVITPRWRIGARADGWRSGRESYKGVEAYGSERAVLGVVEFAPRGRLGLVAQGGLGRMRLRWTNDSWSGTSRIESAGLAASGSLSYAAPVRGRVVIAPYAAYVAQLRHRVTINGAPHPELYLRGRLLHAGMSFGWR